MYINYNFKDGSNPYISTTNKSLLWMLMHYEYEQTSEQGFYITGKKMYR